MRRIHWQRNRRAIVLAGCLALALAGGPAALLAAEPAAEPAADTDSSAGVQAAEPSATDLERAAEALAEAKGRSVAADAAYSRMKRSNRPRGAARHAIVQERAQAHRALLDALEHYEALERGARGNR
jgi:hypothetical protein